MSNAATVIPDDSDIITLVPPPPESASHAIPPPPESGTRVTATAMSFEMLYRAALGELGDRDREIEAMKLSMLAVELVLIDEGRAGNEMAKVLAAYLADARAMAAQGSPVDGRL